MIEPPKNIGDCRNIFIAAGLRVDELMDMQFFPNACKLAEILNELEALRAIVKELAATDEEIYADDGFCIFCGETGKHEEDCLVARAKELVK